MQKHILVFLLFLFLFSCEKEGSEEKKLPEQVTTQSIPDLEVPSIYIKTQNKQFVNSKNTAVKAELSIGGLKTYLGFKANIQIKGRGNYSWLLPKKAYKIEFEESHDLMGMGKDKDWVLLANYLDFNHFTNAVGFTIAQNLSMPFTTNFKPVELYLNESYQGLYLLTEQVEKEKNRVDIDDLGLLFELDTYYDDLNKFKSTVFNLPINIKYPKEVNSTSLALIKSDFTQLENCLNASENSHKKLEEMVDVSTFSNFFILSYLTDNQELNHPKSVFMYKNNDGKYSLGPAWDYDWGFSYNNGASTYFNNANGDLFWKNSSSSGNRFFSKFLANPTIRTDFKNKWIEFKNNKLNLVLKFIDDYSVKINEAKLRDAQRWEIKPRDYGLEAMKMKNWLNKKAEYMDNMVKNW